MLWIIFYSINVKFNVQAVLSMNTSHGTRSVSDQINYVQYCCGRCSNEIVGLRMRMWVKKANVYSY